MVTPWMNPCTGNVISNLTTNLVYTQSNPSRLCRTSVMLYQAVEETDETHVECDLHIYDVINMNSSTILSGE